MTKGCAAASIPDNIPPAPPKRTGAAITAPSNAPAADEPAMEGFGGDGFGGVTPTIEVAPSVADEPVDEPEDASESTEDAAEEADGAAKSKDAPSKEVPEKPAQ